MMEFVSDIYIYGKLLKYSYRQLHKHQCGFEIGNLVINLSMQITILCM